MSRASQFFRLFAALFGAAFVVLSGGAEAAEFHVRIDDSKFTPDHLIIAAGDTVIWTSSYGVRWGSSIIGAPSVTFNTVGTNAAVSGCSAIPKNETCVVTFPDAGVYTYQNDLFGAYQVQGTITVTDNALPVVTVSAPTNNFSFKLGSNLSVSGEASDEDGTVRQVELLILNDSWTNSFAVSQFPGGTLGDTNAFAGTANATNFVAGTNAVRAVATDSRGGTTSLDVTVMVETNSAPEVSLEALRLGSSAFGPALLVTAMATDPEAGDGGGLARVEFFLNGESRLAVTNTTQTVDSVEIPITRYSATIGTNLLNLDSVNTLVIEAEDAAGLTNAVTNSFQFSDLMFSVDKGTVSVSGGAIAFDLQVETGVQYRLESSVNLLDWVTEFTFTATSATRPFIGFADRDSMRFYRVVKDLGQ